MFNYLVSMPLSKSILRMNLFIFLIRKTVTGPNDNRNDHKECALVYKVISKPINIKEVIKILSNKSPL